MKVQSHLEAMDAVWVIWAASMREGAITFALPNPMFVRRGW